MTARFKRRWHQFSLGTLLLLFTAAWLLVWWDPFHLKPPAPVPIQTVALGATARVDVIEVNEQYDSLRRTNFRQVIFWSRYPDGKLHIRQWKLVGNSRDNDFQVHHSGNRQCSCSWVSNGTGYRVEAPTFRESKTSGDPELLDRLALPKRERQPLWR